MDLPAGAPRPTSRQLALWTLVSTVAWLAESLVSTGQSRNMYAGQPGAAPPLVDLWVPSLGSAILWVPFTVLLLWLAYRFPVTGARVNVLVHLAALAVVVVGRALGVVLFNGMFDWYPNGVPGYGELLNTSLFNNLVTFVFVSGIAHAVFYQHTMRTREAQFADARMAALTSQLQPHFLFNALNTIAAYVHQRPAVAERMIVDLSALLRYSVDRDHAALVALDDEIEIAEAYLAIQRNRFADRLQVAVEVDRAVRDAAVPPFLLQPLLENAVQHGLAPQDGASALTITAHRDAKEVVVVVGDDGVGVCDDGAVGVGLSNVRARLAQVYGAGAGLTLGPRNGGGTNATIRLPYRRYAPTAAVRATKEPA
ncbi:sensor histidine kinase [Nocardioides speluncae]|uniref:sensor histidine kinase n=1 Tax=Nocardioides speluncae TaxID=2670337 RepID=UPI000D69B379|nr:histidine kinase [Nocardioides speluncae]